MQTESEYLGGILTLYSNVFSLQKIVKKVETEPYPRTTFFFTTAWDERIFFASCDNEIHQITLDKVANTRSDESERNQEKHLVRLVKATTAERDGFIIYEVEALVCIIDEKTKLSERLEFAERHTE